MRWPAALRTDVGPGRVVPPAGVAVWLTLLTSAAMGFLAVLALSLSLAADRLAGRWAGALERTATVRVPAAPGELDARAERALEVLRTTPGVAAARRLGPDEAARLLEPWLGPDLPLSRLPVPALIEVVPGPDGPDAAGLRARLAGEVPGAVYDDHARWRAPLAAAAGRLRALGAAALALIGAATAAMVALAAQAALAANGRIIATLRLLGAEDVWIARAFVRRFTLRATAGAALGAAAGAAALAAMPATATGARATGALATGALATGLRFAGAEWLWPLAVPLAAAAAAFAATRAAAFRKLRETR